MEESWFYNKREVLEETNSPYGYIQIVRIQTEDGPVRLLTVNDSIESAMYEEKEKQDDLIFPYMKCFDYAFRYNPLIKKACLIGAGGFAYPRHFLHEHADKQMDAFEISEDIIELSKKYFALDELGENFRLFQQDGFAFLRQHEDIYELIINDAFIGNKPGGRTLKDMKLIADHLSEDGVYLVNMVSALQGVHAGKLSRQVKYLLRYFNDVTFAACEDGIDPWELQNCLIIAWNPIR